MQDLFLSSDLCFATLEGEGAHVGVPSVFMRLSMCNLTCKGWATPENPNGCDSKSAWMIKNRYTPETLFELFELKGLHKFLQRGDLWKLSVRGTECVPVTFFGAFDLLPIKDLWELPGQVSTFDNVEKKLLDVSITTNTLGLNGIEPGEVKELFRHVGQSVVQIFLQNGFRLDLTPSHGAMVLTDEGIVEEKSADTLRSGDRFLIPRNQARPTETFHAVEYAELLGYYVAEGCADKQQTLFTLGDESELALRIDELLRSQLNVETVSIYHIPAAVRRERTKETLVKAKDTDQYTVRTQACYGATLKAACGHLASNKRVPQVLFSASKICQATFLAALIEGDGFVVEKPKSKVTDVGIVTVSYQLAQGVVLLYQQLGFLPRCEIAPTLGPDGKPTGSTTYKILISGSADIQELQRLYRPSSSLSKLAKAQVFSLKSIKTASFGIPLSFLSRPPKSCGTKVLSWKAATALKLNIEQRCNPGSLGAHGYVKDGKLTAKALKFLRVYDILTHWQIVEVVRVEASGCNEWFYDLSVPGNNTFFAGLGGVCVHNTGGEPLIQQKALLEFVQLATERWELPLEETQGIEFETNGTLLPDPGWAESSMASIPHVSYVVSPKLANNGDPEEKRYKPNVLDWHAGNDGSTFKFVVTSEADVEEIKAKYLDFKNHYVEPSRVWLMPEGTTTGKIQERAPWVAEICKREGFNFSQRLQIFIWNQALGV